MATRHLLATQYGFIALCYTYLTLLNLVLADCPTRAVLTSDVGEISMQTTDYPINSYCQWLIYNNESRYINIHFEHFLTECDFDYLYVYKGDSFSNHLIGSYSGATIPDSISVSSEAVLIHFYSDLNYRPTGGSFKLLYSLTECEFGCSPCSGGRCLCSSSKFTGVGCTTEQCVADSDCNDNGECTQDVFDKRNYCECTSESIGRKCDVIINSTDTGAGEWRELAPSGVGFESRTGHSAVYDETTNSIWVFGGSSLTTVTNQLIRFNLATNRWELESINPAADWPQASYNHKAVAVDGCMYVSGGRNLTHALTQFWRFCFSTSTWSMMSDLPEGVAHHTMTLVDSKVLYIIGGLTSQQTISHSIYKFDTDNLSGQWEQVLVRAGNELDVNSAGHSTIYHPDSRSLVVFGGHKRNIARFSRHNNEIYSFHVDKQHWSHITYSTSVGSVPPALAFHTADLMGNYMVVYGGQVRRQSVNSCISNKVYAYHLTCHRWVSLTHMYEALQLTEPTLTPETKGRHSHASLVLNGNILVIVGGYRGNVLADLHSYKVLPSIARNTADSDMGTDYCDNYQVAEGCVTDPECIWCPSPPISGCASRTKANMCSDPVEYSCPGLCSAISDCQSCVVQSHNVTAPVYPLLRQLEPCAWCIHDRTCQPMSQPTGSCQQPPAEPVGWWMGGATQAVSQSACVSSENKPAGFRYSVNVDPVNPGLADQIVHSDEVLVKWDKLSKDSLPTYSKALFYLHPNGVSPPSRVIKLKLMSQYADTNITLHENGKLVLLAKAKPPAVSTIRVYLARSNPADEVLPVSDRGTRYLLQVDAVNTNTHESYGKFALEWNAPSTSEHSHMAVINKYLEPFSGGNCSIYQSCLSCQIDVGCGWCPSTQLCVSRSDNSLTSAECGTHNPQHWLVTEPSLCQVCTDYIDCQHCVTSGVCEWSHSALTCQRLGLESVESKRAVNTTQCPSPCNQRHNCSECLLDKDECIWCDSTQSCDQFSPYLIVNSYGQCKSWSESHLSESTCLDCSSFTTCSDCLAESSCGWCGNDFNPNIGVCTSGDYSTDTNCSSLIHSLLNVTEELLSLNLSAQVLNNSNIEEASSSASFSYAQCPDVLECSLGIDECHENATCVNTPQSYECNCNLGFEGDGKELCNRTCLYECIQGTCSGPPNFQCDCDLGWTNITCDVDCGCNNHSTCLINGTGTCDLCQDMTYGEHCEFCLPKSYGNATIAPGCLPCDCNGHGLSELDLCDGTTGVCYCEDGYVGDHCEQCDINSIGDPRNGQPCYEYSHNRIVILNATGESGITSQGKYEGVPYTRWIISPLPDLYMDAVARETPHMTFTLDSINTTCPEGYVYVYDGINIDDSLGYVAAYCGSADYLYSSTSVDIYSGYITVVYYGNSTNGEMFTARYTVHQCNDSCYGNWHCDNSGSCVCKEGFGGVDCGVEICPDNCSSHGHCNQDSQSCFCEEGYAGNGCSLESFLTVNKLVDGAVVSVSPDPRQAFTVVDCGSEGYVLFGGFSTEDGLLNDLWRFGGGKWSQIIPTNPTKPPGRYLHAAVCVDNLLIIHGGQVMSPNGLMVTDDTLWIFSFTTMAWWQSNVSTTDLAGHTLTSVGGDVLLVVGGYSLFTDWNNYTYSYNYKTNTWLGHSETTGAVPAGLMMHSAVYDKHSDALYIHGGYRYYIDRYFPSNETFFYTLSDHRWYKRADEKYSSPVRRYAHSAVQLDNKMIVIGGLTSNYQHQSSINLYSYDCDRWHTIGELPVAVRGHTSILNDSTVYIFSSTQSSVSVHTITLPNDMCTLYSGSSSDTCTSQRGCHACNDTGYFHCFDNKTSAPPYPCNGSDATSLSLLLDNDDSCDASIVADRDCKAHKDCAQCLTAWPRHGISSQKCKWCSFCNVGLCIKMNQKCEEENVCSRVQSEKFTADTCIEQRCRSATCTQCSTESQDADGCIWTRQFMRSSEVGRQVSAMPFPNWNCVTKILINLSAIPVWSSPPEACPAPCQSFSTCTSCLKSSGGGAGGAASCFWSERLNMCIPPSALPLMCDYGQCSPLLESGNSSMCPRPCYEYTQCGHCLAHPHCGWCAQGLDDKGIGVCMEGSNDGPTSNVCGIEGSNTTVSLGTTVESVVSTLSANYTPTSNLTFSWHFTSCPLENECLNDHHNCDLEKQDCTDLVLGHHCRCKDGYLMIGKECVPQCNPACVNGECVKPDLCDCDFSWVGASCSVPCECNLHSECAGPEATDNCTNCLHNTMGERCELCEKLAVGNATNGGACEDCFTLCNNHSPICMDNKTRHQLVLLPNQSLTDAYLFFVDHGPVNHKDVVCIDCANNTAGPRCSHCVPGYFRLSDDPTAGCVECMCHGHGFACDESTGSNCNCQNNTKSTCQTENKCYEQQCNQCSDQHVGTPVNGHQCYERLTTDEHHCISRNQPYSNCFSAEPLPYGQAAMFAVLPKFLNVDIKVYINVEEGEVEVYISKSDDFFIIDWDHQTQQHLVKVDPKYKLVTERRKRSLFDDHPRVRRSANTSTDTSLYLVEPALDPNEISNYVYAESTDSDRDSVYYIRGVRNRLIVTFPESKHQLRTDKFFVVMVGTSKPHSRGTLVFRQDQIRIELFVFFAVFFSCFFKFLSICVICWKIRSMYQQQQQRQQRAVELDQMASRPFSSLLVHFDDMCIENPLRTKRSEFQINPASCEITDDGVAAVSTVMLEMPGGKDVPTRAMFGSTLVTLRVMYPNRKTISDRPKTTQT